MIKIEINQKKALKNFFAYPKNRNRINIWINKDNLNKINPKDNKSKIEYIAEIALMNNLISECDSICKFIITNIQKQIERIDKLDTDFIINFSKSFLGFLIMVPSNLDDPFQLIRGFINLFTLPSLPKNSLISKVKLSIFLSMTKFVTTQLQNRLPYHVFNVESNNEIFSRILNIYKKVIKY